MSAGLFALADVGANRSQAINGHAPSFSESAGRRRNLDTKVRNMTLLAKPSIEIKLHHPDTPHGAYVTTYSTMDKIEGTVSITAKNDTKFDDIEIAFIGKVRHAQ